MGDPALKTGDFSFGTFGEYSSGTHNYPPEVRRLIYTTNAIEALNSKIRRAVRTRGHFPSDEAAAKLIYLALNATSTEWKRSVRNWHAVKSQFAIMFEDRFPMA